MGATWYEVPVGETLSREVHGGVHGPWQSEGMFMVLPPPAEEAFDSILQPYGLNSDIWFWRLEVNVRRGDHGLPWAIIALDKEYRLAGHFCQIRRDKSMMPFTSYSLEPGYTLDQGVPPISTVYVMQKAALAEAAGESLFLRSAWEVLADKPEDRHYICFPDPLPEDWVQEHGQGDDDLFLRQLTSD